MKYSFYALILFSMRINTFAVDNHQTYQTPLVERYSRDGKMSFIFSAQHKYATWRRIWIALAQAEKDLGISVITQDHIDQLQQHADTINFDQADRYEKELHHDVMAHIHAYGDQCPEARAILHLGATSCLVTDNADIIIMKEALAVIRNKLITVVKQLACQAKKHSDRACLSYTHLQPAQPTTVGKRFTLWLQDLLLDMHELDHCLNTIALLGAKGATGTQASFMKLFEGNHEKVKKLEEYFARNLGITNIVLVSGQTYTRKQDIQIMNVLGNIAVSAHKMATDMRLLAHLKEITEPQKEKQVGSSAMPYKKNPILSERICSLSRFMLSLMQNAHYTAAVQWLERTLDDSANRRLMIPEAFLAIDAILDLLITISNNMVVHPHSIEQNLNQELPFLATENILMACVQKGADRQMIHECIRQHSHLVANTLQEGGSNDLLQRLAQDSRIPLTLEEIQKLVDIRQFIGRSPEQVTEFLSSLDAIISSSRLCEQSLL